MLQKWLSPCTAPGSTGLFLPCSVFSRARSESKFSFATGTSPNTHFPKGMALWSRHELFSSLYLLNHSQKVAGSLHYAYPLLSWQVFEWSTFPGSRSSKPWLAMKHKRILIHKYHSGSLFPKTDLMGNGLPSSTAFFTSTCQRTIVIYHKYTHLSLLPPYTSFNIFILLPFTLICR